MLWIAITALCAVAVGLRLYTLRGRPQVWWLAFTGTLVFIVAGAGFLMNETVVNDALGVANLAYLLSNLSFTAAAGSVQVYVHSLRHETPSARWMLTHVGTAAAVALVVAGGWLLAPVHVVAYPTFRAAPFSPEALAYDGVFHLYLGLVLGNVSVCAARLVRETPRDDPGRRYGLILTASSAALDVLAHLLYLVEVALSAALEGRMLPVASVADLLTLVAMFGIVSGTVTFLIVPPCMAHLHARRLIRALEPLWARVLELEPTVALPNAKLGPALRVERMIIEINDGLRRLTVPAHGAGDPYRAAAEALVTRDATGVPLTRVLPELSSRRDEEAVLLHLAQTYDHTRGDLARAS